VLAFTDSDCVPDACWLHEGVRAVESAAMVQGRVEAVSRHGPFDRTLWVTWAWGLYETANLFVRREAFERVGGFGAGLEASDGAPFGEDTIFGWNVRRLGFEAAFCETAIVRHAVVPRSARATITEHLRDRYFPHLVRAVPELRGVFLYRRVFLNRRRALLYPALAGVAWAAGRRDARPTALAVPYLRELVADADRIAPRSMRWTVATALSAGDLVGAASSLRGSVEARTLVF
jgi:GT2 family glycosyltransferase